MNGEITSKVDGERTVLRAGASPFAPRGTAHGFRNFDDVAAEMLIVVFNRCFEELASLNAGRSTPDMAGTERLARNYGVEILGPPLS